MSSNPKVESSSPKRTRLSSIERRKQLLNCALSAYANLGVERAGHGDVAKLAGVSTATVFNYFATREILTDAVFSIIREKFLEVFRVLPGDNSSASEQVKKLAHTYSDFTEAQTDLIKVMLNWSVAFGPDVRRQFLDFQDQMLTIITNSLHGDSKGSKDRSDARLILAAADMFAQMKLDNTDEDTIGRFVERVANALK